MPVCSGGFIFVLNRIYLQMLSSNWRPLEVFRRTAVSGNFTTPDNDREIVD